MYIKFIGPSQREAGGRKSKYRLHRRLRDIFIFANYQAAGQSICTVNVRSQAPW